MNAVAEIARHVDDFAGHDATGRANGDFILSNAPDLGVAQPKENSTLSAEFSSSSKIGWGGARLNSGGPRPNSGGPRQNSGGSRPNSGGARPNSGPKPATKAERVIQSRPLGDRWYVIQIAHGCEDRVMRELAEGESRPGHIHRPWFETLMPLTKAVRTRRGVKSILKVPMIRGWGFVRFDAASDPWQLIRGCDGVTDLITTRSQRPIPVSDREIALLVKRSDAAMGLDPLAMPKRAAGTQMRVTVGAFADFAATCIACDGITTVATVWIFGRDTVIELPWTDFIDVPSE